MHAGQSALESAERQGVAEALEEAEEETRALRHAARERAEREGALPPVIGWTYVRSYVPSTAARGGAEEAADQARMVQLRGLRGLLVVQATLTSSSRTSETR